MKRTPLLALTLLLAACGHPTTPISAPSSLLGQLALPISTALTSQDLPRLTLREGDVTVTALGPATVQSTANFDYLRAQFQLTNTGTTPFANLSLVAVARSGNVGGTAIKTITDFGGITSANQATQAVKSLPMHSVTVEGDGSLSLVSGATDFQAFTPSEVSELTSDASWNTSFGASDKPLTYGFVASKCAEGVCTRTLMPGESGVVNIMLRVPKDGAAGSVYNFVMNFAVVNDTTSRVTKSVTPTETAEEASARLTALGVTEGGEVMTVGQNATIAPGRTTVNTPGLKVVSAPFVTTLAGTGTAGFADGFGTNAQFEAPAGIDVDASGTVYVSDFINNRIRTITADGMVSTLAGSGDQGSTDATGTQASFNMPWGLTVDSIGTVYVADWSSHKIRMVTSTGVVTTLAGNGSLGSVDGTGTAASFRFPGDVALDADGNIFVADYANNKIRMVTPAGVVTTLAGSGAQASDDGTGTAASFNRPNGLIVDSGGTVFVTDRLNNKIRQVSAAGVVTTLAGSGSQGSVDGTGTGAEFSRPTDIAQNSTGDFYVVDVASNKIRQVTRAGVVTTFAGTGVAGGADGEALSATFNQPFYITVDDNDDVYVTDQHRVRKIYMP